MVSIIAIWNVSGGGVTKRILLGKLIDTEKETIDVSGMIPDDILEEYLNLVNEHAKLEKEHADLRKEVDTGKQKLTEKMLEYGIVTTSEKNPTFENLVLDLEEVATVRYNKGYNSGISYADGRNNTESMSYKTGYNAGVAAADGRPLPGTTNYQSGYNAGHSAGYSQGVAAADARENTSSYNWGCGWNAGVAAADGRALPGTVNYQSGYNAGVSAELETIASAWKSHGTVTGRLFMYIVVHNYNEYIWNVCNMGNQEWIRRSLTEVYGDSFNGIRIEIFCVDGLYESLAAFDYWICYQCGFPGGHYLDKWSWVL